ncbi:hypothetical protein [Fervidibacter sacchari]
MASSFVSELAQRLGKSEEEVVQFLQTLWQILPPSPETQPYFFRYLDERFLRLEDRYTHPQDELRQQFEVLKEALMRRRILLRQEIEAIHRSLERAENWLFVLNILAWISATGVLVLLVQILLSR